MRSIFSPFGILAIVLFGAGLVAGARSVPPTRQMLLNRKPGAPGSDLLLDQGSFDPQRYTEEGRRYRDEAVRRRRIAFWLCVLGVVAFGCGALLS